MPDQPNGIETSRITITRTYHPDAEEEFRDQVSVTITGDPSIVEQIGMLAMAQNTILAPGDEADA